MPPHHGDDEYLDAIRNGNHGTTAIAEYVGVARQSAYERLHSLAEDGEVEKETIGNSLRWSLPD